MALRQIRKYPKKSLNRKSRSRKNYTNSKIVQCGSGDGRYVLPPAYFGKGMQGYHADGSSSLNSYGKQHAVSQGVISGNGKWAGPNLYPTMGGGSNYKKSLKPHQKGGSNCKKSLKPHQKGGSNCKKSLKSRK
jgi:hypothetical protein